MIMEEMGGSDATRASNLFETGTRANLNFFLPAPEENNFLGAVRGPWSSRLKLRHVPVATAKHSALLGHLRKPLLPHKKMMHRALALSRTEEDALQY